MRKMASRRGGYFFNVILLDGDKGTVSTTLLFACYVRSLSDICS